MNQRLSIWVPLAVVALLLRLGSGWRMYKKAGQPGWMVLVPFGNILGLLKMIDASPLWVLLYGVPGLNLIVHFVVMVLVAQSFGRGVIFGVGQALVPSVFQTILAFG